MTKYVIIQGARPDLKCKKEILKFFPHDELDEHSVALPSYTAPLEMCCMYLKEEELQQLINQDVIVEYTKDGPKLVKRDV